METSIKPPIIYTDKEYRAFLQDDLIQIGDDKEAEFKPTVKLSRWKGEAYLKVGLDDSFIIDKSHRLDDQKIKWESPKTDIHIYMLNPSKQIEHGGLEYEVILKTQPPTNIITLSTESKNLSFRYVPFLTQEEIDKGYIRPENVQGSYFVYHSTKKHNEYKTGKAFHIFRPKAIDANGWEMWGELHIENGLMTITLPQDFIDKAVYPIRHASGAIFGKNDVGTDGDWGNPRFATIATKFTLPENGTVTSITLYVADAAGNYSVGIYDHHAGDDEPENLLVESAVLPCVQDDWTQLDIADTPLVAGTYWLSFSDASNANSRNPWDTAGRSCMGAASHPDPFGVPGWTGARETSIYVTYTPDTNAGGGGAVAVSSMGANPLFQALGII